MRESGEMRGAAVKRVRWRGINEEERLGAERRGERPRRVHRRRGQSTLWRYMDCGANPWSIRGHVGTHQLAASQADTGCRRFSPGRQKCPIPAFICLARRRCDVAAIFRLVSITCPHASPAGTLTEERGMQALLFLPPDIVAVSKLLLETRED